jgi:hypothetical protein
MTVDEKTWEAMPARLKKLFRKVPNPGSEEVLAGFPMTSSGKAGGDGHKRRASLGGCSTVNVAGRSDENAGLLYGDTGTAARFFYCAKAGKAEREHGLLGHVPCVVCAGLDTETHIGTQGHTVRCRRNSHPTVKPVALMRYLCTLVTMPERNLILDPFAGSGTTGVACKELGLSCVLVEKDEHACEIAVARCAAARVGATGSKQGVLWEPPKVT